jgi:Leucine-rich repeat (LRR) protein
MRTPISATPNNDPGSTPAELMLIPSTELQAPSIPLGSLQGAGGASAVAVFGSALAREGTGNLSSAKSLWLSGATVEACNLVAELTGLESLVVHDWRAADLEPLARLSKLKTLAIAGSSRLKRLDGVQALHNLESLILFDNCGYTSIAPVARATSLQTLCLEGGFSKQLRIDSLAPLEGLTSLVRLRLASISVADGSLSPLHGLQQLRNVFIAKNFRASELRALALALPLAKGEFLDSNRPVT